jgi:hypothetical protein
VVVEVAVRDGDVVASVGDVQQAVVVVLARTKVTADIEVIEPDVGGLLDTNAIAALDLAELQVADDDVLDALDENTGAGNGYNCGSSASLWPSIAGFAESDVQAPAFPRMLVLAPTLTEPVPLMLPETIIIFLASPLTASVSAERLETVVVVPPAPPVVLSGPRISDSASRDGGGRRGRGDHDSPSVGGSIANVARVIRAGTLDEVSGCRGNKAHQRGNGGGEEELHNGVLSFSRAY